MKPCDSNNEEIYPPFDIPVFTPEDVPWVISQAVSQIRCVNDGQIIAYRHRNGELYLMRLPSSDINESDLELIEEEIVPNSLA